MTDIVKAPPFMPSKPQWDATVALLERALEELAQAQAARAEVARLRAELAAANADISSHRNELRILNDRAAEAVTRMIVAEREEKRLTSFVNSTANLKWEYKRWQEKKARAALRQPAPAPAQPDATMLSDNSLQTSSQAPAQGQEE